MTRPATGLLAAMLLTAPPDVAAQVTPAPIPRAAVDLRGFYSGLGQDPITAADLGVGVRDLPTRGLGGVAGVHVYPIRRGRLALGFGGEGILARGRHQPLVAPGNEAPPPAPTVQRLEGLSAQLSLNFGDENGWSYVTGGMGPLRFATWLGDERPALSSAGKATINMGGGARWFARRHVAVTFDVRFYLTRPDVRTPDYPGRQRSRLVILSAGLSLK